MQESNSKFDIVIVGGGPAGSSTAIQCAKKGMSVVVLERESFPRARPGETLHPGVLPILKKLEVEREFLNQNYERFSGTWSNLDGKFNLVELGSDSSGPWRGFQAKRSSFDKLLLDKAIELGVQVAQPCQPRTLISDGGRVLGVETLHQQFESSLVVDCSGGKHWLARRLGLKVETFSPPMVVGYGYQKECKWRDDQLPRYEVKPDGWTWWSKVGDNQYAWVQFGENNDAEKTDGQRSRRENVTWRFVSLPAGPGYVLAGDAACVLDPSAGHGVLRALMSGMMAAEFCAGVLDCPTNESSLAQSYKAWLWDWYSHDMLAIKNMKRKQTKLEI